MYMYMCMISYIEHLHRKKERKKERHLRQWKNENESCLRWDSNPRHSVHVHVHVDLNVHVHVYITIIMYMYM